ncbi:glycerate kinase [Rubrobacter radiotolerans]|nr:glycerate kinase [Rubrobacter radiotolerans]MDX5892511.1 glycerate kinase [Rubrobacter radiotolerans]
MKVLIAPSGFKESLEPGQAADCIEAGIRRVVPEAEIYKAPLVDGGEGFTRALVRATGGELEPVTVTGPVGEPVAAHYGFLGGPGPKTAVLEMAAAAGLRLVPKDVRDPRLTTTYGVGELIRAALNAGAERILVGCGDSGTSDGGAGMAQALGARFLDSEGEELPVASGGRALSRLAEVDLSGLDRRLREVRIDVACNWHNLLCGENGVARVFGPQKGATSDQVEELAAALENYAAVIERDLGLDVRESPGSGASGGLGAGLVVVGAKLYPRYEIVMEYLEIDGLLERAELVFTAEGGIDFQTPRGKIPAEVARRAKERDIPVIALAGTVGPDAEVNYEAGIDAYASVLKAPTTLEEAVAHAEELLKEGAESSMRMVLVGRDLAPGK